MSKKRQPKIPTSFRLTKTAYELLQGLVKATGLARGACLELAIRDLAKRWGFTIPLSGYVTREDKQWWAAEVQRKDR